jgi:hypothetical protein
MDNIEFAKKVFIALAREHETRMERGARLRKEMHEALQEGREAVGYRPDFIRDSAILIIQALGELAKEFDAEHPDDKCSGADLMDIIATVAGLLKGQQQ